MSTTTDKSAELSAVKRALIALEDMKARLHASEQRMHEPLAIVGLACRFPGGADTPERCWDLLREGRDAITEVPPDRWDVDAYYDPDPDAPGKMSTRWGGFLRDIDRFDPELFGISPREAVTMDPQQRILLEVVWEALERAGQSPERLLGSRTGVFLGIATNDYAEILAQNTAADRIDAYFASGVAHSIASGRISYCLGLQGPSVSIDTACSSSLVAVYQACQSLRTGDADMAIAAGVNIVLRPDHGITFSKSRMMAPDGRCKTFDARADGFVRAEGCGVVVLKRLRDAEAAGDTIMAVIRGTAINQDGASSGLTAPNGASQEALLRAALANAHLRPEDVAYIEAHGTGTSLGDPIEVRALGNVFGRGRDPSAPLLIGSAKTNFGHLESAAGITGLIKVVLALMNREIPPSLHFQSPNPHIAWDELPIRVAAQRQEFPLRNGRRIAGVSSFGFSGTNAHILLEEAPARQESSTHVVDRSLHPLVLSAKSETALKQLAAKYVHHFEMHRDHALAHVCHTAASGRAHFPYRLALTGSDRDSVLRELRAWSAGEASSVLSAFSSAAVRPKIGFLFTGQGSQYAGMGRELYASEPVFRGVLDRCAAVLDEQLPRGLLNVMFEDQSGLLDQTIYTQPALFALEVGVAQLWRSWGIEPAVVLGHSVGEYAAACVAGALSIEDGARLVAARARLMQSLPSGGAMVAVQGDELSAVERAVGERADLVSIAAHNAPGSIVISGDKAAIEEISSRLHGAGLVLQPLTVSHAFHSPLMTPMLQEYSRIAQSTEHRAPQLGWVSNLTGEMVRWNEWSGRMGEYWSRHVREPVRFDDGVRYAAAQGIDYFIEVGPHPVLAGLGRATVGAQRVNWLASLKRGRGAWEQLLESVARLYTGGGNIDWAAFDAPYVRRKLVLPTYPFQRERYWVEAKARGSAQERGDPKSLLGTRIDTPALSGALFKNHVGANAAASFAMDHCVFGLPVLPGTGFIAMAAAAAAKLLRQDAVELREVAFDEALPIPESDSRELQLVARETNGAFRIEIFSRESDASNWTLHSKALAARANPLSASAGSYENLRSRCDEMPTHSAFYEDLARRGLDFGPLFRGVKSVQRGDRVAVGEVELPAMLHGEAANYMIHPVLLDACVQVLAAATARSAPADAVFLPVQIDVCRLMSPSAPLLACRAEALIREVHPSGQALTADVRVSDSAGRYIALLEGIQLKRVGRDALDRIGTADIQNWMIELMWRPEPNGEALRTEAIAAAVRASSAAREAESGWSEWAHVQTQIDAICRAYIATALRELGCIWQLGDVIETDSLAGRLGVKAEFRRLLNRFLQILAADGLLQSVPGGWRVVHELPQLDADSALRALMERHPAFSAELTFAARCGPNIAAALTGRCDPLQLLFPAGDASTAERLYRDSPSAKLYNGIVSDAVAEIIARLPIDRPIRILEIGGGTGSTTAHVLPRLPTGRVEYVFTDISPLFVARAQERYGSGDVVRAQPLDIERDPAAQGVTGEFDIIIAANVLHATRDLADVFQRVRTMLSPNGVLVALEITRPQDWIDISFGFTEGWWRFADAWRADYPLLTKPQWKQFLDAQGYGDVTLLPSESQSADPLDLNAVIIARKDTARSRPVDIARRWLVLADESGVGARLTQMLEQGGSRVTTAVLGAGYATTASGAYTINPTRSEDFVRLVQEATTALEGPLDGVVHLWGIDAHLHRVADVRTLRERVAQVQGGLLHLGQALLKTNPTAPPLWIATRGAVAIGDEPIAPLAAATWGWARALRLEYPDWRCVSVDLDPGDEVASAHALAATLARQDDETQIAWRQRTSFIARLSRARLGAAADNANSPDAAPLRLAVTSRGVLDNLALEPFRRAAPGPGQVEIRVRAAGLNFRDVLSVLDMYPGDQGPLGSECAGQVVAIGPGVDSVRVGEEVVAIAPGAFATHVIADARLVVPRPHAVTCVEAASIPNVFLTAQWALERLGGMKAGDRVLIHAGAGGVGLAAIQLAKRIGAEIFATAGSDEKRDYLRSLGVRHVFSSRSLEFAEQIRSVTDGRGVDLVLNSLAGEFIPASISAVAHGGVFLEIGRTGIWTQERVRAIRPDIAYHTIDLGKDYAATPEIIRPMLISLLDDIASGRLQRPPLRTFALRDAAAAYRHMAQARHIGKLVLTQSWTAGGEAPQIREDASYLITGGLSGLGLATAGWLVDRGARCLVLMGRRSPQPAAQKVLDTFSQRGVHVLIVQGDVSDEHDIAHLIAQMDAASVPPLAGIVHAAGSLDDGVLTAQSMERYARVFAAKVYGAWLLDRATRTRPIDFLIFFSSAAGLLGSAGQTNHAAANAYLDALAVQLRAEGRAAVSIQWGAWSQIGAAAGDDLAARLAEAGLQPIAPAQGLKAFAKALQHAPANIGIVNANWDRIAERWPPKLRAYAAELIEARASAPLSQADSRQEAASRDELNARLAAAPVKKRRALLQAEIRSLAMKVLSLPATHTIDLKAPLNGLGLDSLMAVELRNLLGRAIGRSLPATLLFDHPSIEALTSHLATLLNIEPQGAAPSTPQSSGQGGADLLDQVEQLSEEELDRLLAAKMKVH